VGRRRGHACQLSARPRDATHRRLSPQRRSPSAAWPRSPSAAAPRRPRRGRRGRRRCCSSPAQTESARTSIPASKRSLRRAPTPRSSPSSRHFRACARASSRSCVRSRAPPARQPPIRRSWRTSAHWTGSTGNCSARARRGQASSCRPRWPNEAARSPARSQAMRRLLPARLRQEPRRRHPPVLELRDELSAHALAATPRPARRSHLSAG
jgi:hypothetical protein